MPIFTRLLLEELAQRITPIFLGRTVGDLTANRRRRAAITAANFVALTLSGSPGSSATAGDMTVGVRPSGNLANLHQKKPRRTSK